MPERQHRRSAFVFATNGRSIVRDLCSKTNPLIGKYPNLDVPVCKSKSGQQRDWIDATRLPAGRRGCSIEEQKAGGCKHSRDHGCRSNMSARSSLWCIVLVHLVTVTRSHNDGGLPVVEVVCGQLFVELLEEFLIRWSPIVYWV